MFYQKDFSEVLRLGDVVKGFVSTWPTIISPQSSFDQYRNLCSVDIEVPSYSVVLSPCCSIDEGVVCLSPLIGLNNKIVKIPYFREDPTRINSVVEPDYSVPPSVWERPEFQQEKLKRLAVGPSYVFYHYFVYEANDIFKPYSINMRDEANIETNHYMIDFRKIYSLNCGMVKSKKNLTDEDKPLIESKCLELSVGTRSILREKLSYYFWRPAPEDEVLIHS